MSFRTRIDYSSNRQIKQFIETNTVLSGATTFGVPFNYLPTGASSTNSGSTLVYTNIVSTFSGSSATTVYTWYDNKMQLGINRLSALTPSNSATTQQTGNIFTAATSTTIDGNIVNLSYTGVNFDVTCIAMYDLGSGNYSGSVNTTTFYTLTADTTDFTGRTIWVNVSGITRTNDLIINKAPVIGYIWTCNSSEGGGEWSAVSSSGGTSYWSAGSGTFAIVQKYSNSTAIGTNAVAEGFLTIAQGNYSHAEGRNTRAEGIGSHSEGRNTIAAGDYSHASGFGSFAMTSGAHASGSGSTASGLTAFIHSVNSFISGERSVILGGQNITGYTDDTVFVPDFVIKKVAAVPTTSADTIGNIGSITWDNNYFYVKTISGWGRTQLSYAF